MAVQVFSLRGAPEDEAAAVRALLTEHGLDFYETSAGNWGVSLPAIWLRDEERYAEARTLIEAYQAARVQQVREEYEQLRRQGRGRTVLDILRENPLRFIAYLAAIAALLYFSLKPFIDFAR